MSELRKMMTNILSLKGSKFVGVKLCLLPNDRFLKDNRVAHNYYLAQIIRPPLMSLLGPPFFVPFYSV